LVASAKYVVVVDMLGVVKLVPVPKLEPPVETAYQLTVPAEAVAPNVTVPVPHLLLGVDPVMVGIEFIVAITAVLAPVVHPPFVASA
jgi:hypothetical protein